VIFFINSYDALLCVIVTGSVGVKELTVYTFPTKKECLKLGFLSNQNLQDPLTAVTKETQT